MQDVRLRRRIFLTEFFGEFIPIYALVPLLFAEYGQLNALQVGSLLALWQILIVVFEVPTGVVADRYGRKLSMQIGKLMRVVSFPIWLLLPNYLGFVIGIIFLAIGDALLSGSLEAYSYDELEDKKGYNKLRQRTMSIHLAAFTMAGFVSYLLGADFKWILVASIVMSVAGFLTSFLLPRDVVHKAQMSSIKHIVASSYKEIRRHPSTIRFFLRASLILSLMIIFIEQINLFYRNTGVTTETVSLLMAVGNLITFVILWTSHLYEAWTRKYQMHLLTASLLLLYGSVVLTESPVLQIGLVFIFVRFTRLANVNMSNDLQHAVSSSARATIGSLSSFVGTIAASIAMIAVGLGAQSSGDIRLPLTYSGIVLMVLLLVVAVNRNNLRGANNE